MSDRKSGHFQIYPEDISIYFIDYENALIEKATAYGWEGSVIHTAFILGIDHSSQNVKVKNITIKREEK